MRNYNFLNPQDLKQKKSALFFGIKTALICATKQREERKNMKLCRQE